MKKISILLMALVLSMSLAGCSLFSKDQQTSKNNTEQSSSQDNSSDKTTNETRTNQIQVQIQRIKTQVQAIKQMINNRLLINLIQKTKIML